MDLSRYRRVIVGVCFIGVLCSSAAFGDMYYRVTDLGTLGGSTSTGRDINNSGQIVGHSHYSTDSAQHAFIWDADNGMRDLGTLTGNPYDYGSAAYAINDAGQVVGASGLPGATQNAVLWDPVSGTVDLGTLGGYMSYAMDIADNGTIAGGSIMPGTPIVWHAASWDVGGGIADLGAPAGERSAAYGINDHGQIVGNSLGPAYGGERHAVLWDPVLGAIDLGTLGGDHANAQEISEDGTVIGHSTTSDNSLHPFLWDSENGMTDLGTFGGDEGNASGINDAGQVVGFSSTIDGSWRAFIWDADSGMLDLNTLLAPDSLWELQMAYAINDSGQIVGFGAYEGYRRGFLLTPAVVPVPSAVVLGMMGLGLAGACLRKSRTTGP